MRKKRNYWNYKTCKMTALKYKKRSDFKRFDGGAYNAAKKLKILDEICLHMVPIGNRFKRLVYTFMFSDNTVYVGLTKNIDERKEKHLRDKDSAVFKYKNKTGIEPVLYYTDYMDVKQAIQLEKSTIENYRNESYNILNVAKAGAVGGGNLIWTFERCKAEAINYESRKEFAIKSNSAYNSARRFGWLEKICVHMKNSRIHYKKKNYWDKKKCISVSVKCLNRNQFYKKYPGAYMACLKNKWLDEVCKHMIRYKRIKK